jgi:hypothetical protein
MTSNEPRTSPHAPAAAANAVPHGASGRGLAAYLAPGTFGASAFIVVAVAVCALCFALVVNFWTSARGVVGPILADAERPILAAGATVVALALSTAVAIGVGRILNAVVGLFVLGCGVGILAMRTGAARDFAFGGSSLLATAIELFAWTAAIAAASHAVFRFSGRLPDMPETGEDDIDSPHGAAARKAWVAAIAGLALLWLFAATPEKGQAIAAAVFGGIATGAFGRVLAPRTTPVYLAAALPAVCAINALGLAFLAKGELAGAFVDGSLPRFLRVMPVDLAAGSLVGVSLGFGMARSFVGNPDE